MCFGTVLAHLDKLSEIFVATNNEITIGRYINVAAALVHLA